MPRHDEYFRQWRSATSHHRQGARRDPIKKSRDKQACITSRRDGLSSRPFETVTAGKPSFLATLAGQSTTSCAYSNERARACRNQSIRGPTNRRRNDVQRFLCRLKGNLGCTIRTQPSASAISLCLRLVICSRSPAV